MNGSLWRADPSRGRAKVHEDVHGRVARPLRDGETVLVTNTTGDYRAHVLTSTGSTGWIYGHWVGEDPDMERIS